MFGWYFDWDFTQGHVCTSDIAVACVCVCVSVHVSVFVCQSQACLCDNLWSIQARKFGPNVQNTLFNVPIVLGVIDLDLQVQI